MADIYQATYTEADTSTPLPDAFHQLVQDLSKVLGPSSGIDSADVDPEDLQTLMRDYVSNVSEWKLYALSDFSRSYTRNLVDRGNGKSNLVRFPRKHTFPPNRTKRSADIPSSSFSSGPPAKAAPSTTTPMRTA